MRIITPAIASIVLLATISLPARAGERDLLNQCKALVERMSQSPTVGAAVKPEDTEALDHCRQVIKEWTLRDSRMTVDEDGHPLP
ncbi:MAG: hypothetical protein JOY90_22115 [Bradyrhizobium sp.]|uniref:hypothetical protein n=1 Tax=Bradyrhizobium sp. TaxID=376 RepID=UPI001DAEE9BD|nr:hypothetical protein [Bradyrhizobium sp.]MBV9563114.1 hypothetical protein [Bradyrhizobium sp.]